MSELTSAWNDTIKFGRGMFSESMKCVPSLIILRALVLMVSVATLTRSILLWNTVLPTEKQQNGQQSTLVDCSSRTSSSCNCSSAGYKRPVIASPASCCCFNALPWHPLVPTVNSGDVNLDWRVATPTHATLQYASACQGCSLLSAAIRF